jgi:hypothetical protein
MTDERLPEIDVLTPCPAPPRLRASVLAAVDRQLTESASDLPGATAGSSDLQVFIPGATAGLSSSVLPASSCPNSHPTRRSLEKLSAWTVAAALLVGIGLCAWQQQVSARLEALYGPASVRADIAELIRSVESVSGPGSGQWIAERMLVSKSMHFRKNTSPQEPFITTFQLSSVP